MGPGIPHHLAGAEVVVVARLMVVVVARLHTEAVVPGVGSVREPEGLQVWVGQGLSC